MKKFKFLLTAFVLSSAGFSGKDLLNKLKPTGRKDNKAGAGQPESVKEKKKIQNKVCENKTIKAPLTIQYSYEEDNGSQRNWSEQKEQLEKALEIIEGAIENNKNNKIDEEIKKELQDKINKMQNEINDKIQKTDHNNKMQKIDDLNQKIKNVYNLAIERSQENCILIKQSTDLCKNLDDCEKALSSLRRRAILVDSVLSQFSTKIETFIIIAERRENEKDSEKIRDFTNIIKNLKYQILEFRKEIEEEGFIDKDTIIKISKLINPESLEIELGIFLN